VIFTREVRSLHFTLEGSEGAVMTMDKAKAVLSGDHYINQVIRKAKLRNV